MGTEDFCSFTNMVLDVCYKQTSGRHCLKLTYITREIYQQKNIIKKSNLFYFDILKIKILNSPLVKKCELFLKLKKFTNTRLTNTR